MAEEGGGLTTQKRQRNANRTPGNSFLPHRKMSQTDVGEFGPGHSRVGRDKKVREPET